MRRQPIPRKDAYDLYWHFASERQLTFERRLAGDKPPWTDDPILLEFKFCNVFRACDRVSQYMIRNVAYCEEICTPEDRLFQIVAFRIFSRISTWERIRSILGHYPTLSDLANGDFLAAVEQTRSFEGGLYTGAFILCASDAYGYRQKHLNHLELFRQMFLKEDLAARILDATSLREIYNLLHKYPLMGDFMSYQIAIDLNYSELVNFSENEFTQPGPGALRGIRKCFQSVGEYSPAEVVLWMVEHQEQEFERLGLEFHGLWGRPLQAIDCQGLFCETDKYCRVALPDIVSTRKRIKARFRPNPDPVKLFFPPKWGINQKLAQELVVRNLSEASTPHVNAAPATFF